MRKLKEIFGGKAEWKYAVGVISAAVLLTALVLLLMFIMSQQQKDDDSELNKDTALMEIWNMDSYVIVYNGSDITMTNKADVFSILNSGEWKLKGQTDLDAYDPAAVFVIGDNYTVSLYKNNIAEISYGGKSRYYGIPAGTVGNLSQFLDDNTVVTINDMTSLLLVSNDITVEMYGLSCTVNDGQSLVNALNTQSWAVLDLDPPEETPLITISNRIGLKIFIYEGVSLALVEYNGKKQLYAADSLTAASTALTVRSYFNQPVKTVSEKLSSAKELYVTLGDGSAVVVDTKIALVLDFSKWERYFKTPASLAETPDYVISDNQGFTLKLYTEASAAEYNSGFYSVPENVFTKITDYLNKGDTTETVGLRSLILTALSEKKTVTVAYLGAVYTVMASSDLSSALGISSWTDTEKVSNGDSVLTVNLDGNSAFTLSFYELSGTVTVTSADAKQTYAVPETLYQSLLKYVQANLYTEIWNLTAVELGTLQKSAESLEMTVTKRGKEAERYVGDTDDALEILSALNLTPLDGKPDSLSSDKIDVIFKGASRFQMTLYRDGNDSIIAYVSGTFYDKGKHVDRYFITETEKYTDIIASIQKLTAQAYDMIAARFNEAVKSGDIESIKALTGISGYDYSGIATVRINYMETEKTSETGRYTMLLNVADKGSSPFDEGENSYTITVGVKDGKACVLAFAPEDEYKVFSNKSDKASAAVDYFTTWTDLSDETFEKITDIENKTTIAEYLMLLQFNNGKGLISSENSSYIMFTQEELDEAALLYFNAEKYDATDTALYNSESKLYRFEGRSVATEYKRAVNIAYSSESGVYTLAYRWYDDPLCLYETKTVYYDISKSNDGIFMILRAYAETPSVFEPETEEPSAEDETEPSESTEGETAAEPETPIETPDTAEPEPETTGNGEPTDGEPTDDKPADTQGELEAQGESTPDEADREAQTVPDDATETKPIGDGEA